MKKTGNATKRQDMMQWRYSGIVGFFRAIVAVVMGEAI
jgi:hypothetical protein